MERQEPPSVGAAGDGDAMRPLSPMLASPVASPQAPLSPEEVAKCVSEEPDELLGRAVAGVYRLGSLVGSGSFGSVYRARHDRSGHEVAVKCELASAKYAQLAHESKVYALLHERGAVVPRIYWFGTEGRHKVLVMDLLGPSLSELHERCGGRFALEVGLALAEQVVRRLEEVHSAGLLHRDIKPDNFCIGESGSAAHRVFALDFGCAKRYICSETRRHIPEQQGKCMVGTARYASLRAHMGLQQSRRDDLESAGYMLVWFLKGRLPWQGLSAANSRDRLAKITEMKASMSVEALCEDLPREVQGYLLYCRSIRFEEQPDYEHLRSLLRAAAHSSTSAGPRAAVAEPSRQCQPRFDSPPRPRLRNGRVELAPDRGSPAASGAWTADPMIFVPRKLASNN